MKADKLLDEILMIIRTVKEDPVPLQKILDFLNEEIVLPEEEDNVTQMSEDEYSVQIPEKYNNAVKEIAESIDLGNVCFLNTNTLAVDEIPKGLFFSPSDYKMETGFSLKDFNPKYTRWKKYITIEPLESNESFKIMEKFVDQLDNSKLRERLVYALYNGRPFANFKNIIDNSDIRQDWFDFKDKKLQEYVKTMIEINIPEELS